jgi:CRP-like cAMP-binding protein
MDLERLRTVPLFALLDEQALQVVATFATEKSVAAGAHVVKEGEYAYEFMAIQEGEADVVRGGERIGTLGPGDVFGEAAVMGKTQRTASVVATTPMRLVKLSRWHLRRIGDALFEIREGDGELRRYAAAPWERDDAAQAAC